MTKLVITHRVGDVRAWKAYDSERQTNMSAFAKNILSYAAADGADIVAVTMEVQDMSALRDFLASEACDAIMRRHGVIKPVTILVG